MFAKKRSGRQTTSRRYDAKARPSSFAESLEDRLLMYRTYVGGGDEDAKWGFNSLSYSYSNLLDGSISGLSTGQLESLAQESMGVWAAVTPLSFFQVRDAGPLMRDEDGVFADYEPEGLPIVRWGHHNIDGPGNVLAHALRPGEKGQNGDVHIDSANTFTYTGANTGLLETAVHEMGHALGLDHANGDRVGGVCPPALGVIMDACAGSFTYNGQGSAFLTPDDIDGLQSLYGQGLGYVINLSGELHVYGTGVGDLMTANVSGNSVTVTSEIRGLANSARSFTRPLNNGQSVVTSIHLHGMNGDDILRVENNGGLATSLDGNAGGDIGDVQFLGRNFDNTQGPVTFVGGGGNDSAFLYDNANPAADTYTVTAFAVRRPSVGTFHFEYDAGVEHVTLWAGAAANTVNVQSTRAGSRFNVDNGGAADVVNVGTAAAGLRDVRGDVEVRNAPNYTTLNVLDGAAAAPKTAAVADDGTFTAVTGLGPRIAWKNADTSSVNITTGTASDRLNVFSSAKPLTLRSAGGSDEVIVGSAGEGLAGIRGMLTVGAAGSVGQLTLNDAVNSARTSPAVNLIQGGLYNEVTGMAPVPIRYANVRNAAFTFGQGGNDVVFNSPIPAGNELAITGGPGADNIHLRGASTPTVRVNGRNGFDFLYVDDRPGLPANIDSASLFADRVVRYEYPTPENAGRSFTVWYDDVESLDIAHPLAQMITEVFGTSPDIPATHQTVIYGNSSNDNVSVYPRDAAGNSTLPSGLTFYGGLERDVLEVIDNSNLPSAYRIDNRLGPQLATISGAGGGAGNINVVSDVDHINLHGGGGDDTVAFDSFRSGTPMAVYTRGGNDAFEVTPASRNLPASVTNIAALWFNGGADRDSFTLHNQASAADWVYTRQSDRLHAAGPNGYSMTIGLALHEATTVNGGTGADRLVLPASEPGHATTFNGGGGADVIDLGGAAAPAGAAAAGAGVAAAENRVLDRIRGPVFFEGGEGNDHVSLDDSGDFSGDRLHLNGSSVGAHGSDTLFGPGGLLRYGGVETLEMFLGGGGNTIVARPSATTAYNITGGGFFSIGTDTIELDVTGIDGVRYDTDFFGWSATYVVPNHRNIVLLYVERHVETVRTGTVAGRHLFYNNSAFDGRDPAATAADDAAIATGKAALLPGQSPSFANVSSYDKGINGVMVDVVGLPAGAVLSAEDFDTGAGVPAPSVAVRRGAGVNGSDRVTLTWPDYSRTAGDGWLRVTVKANANTGLASPDVFSFGNLVGETGDGTDAAGWRISALDLAAVKRSLSRASDPGGLFDFDRDGRVSALDVAVLKQRLGRGLATSASPAPVAAAVAPTSPPVQRPSATDELLVSTAHETHARDNTAKGS